MVPWGTRERNAWGQPGSCGGVRALPLPRLAEPGISRIHPGRVSIGYAAPHVALCLPVSLRVVVNREVSSQGMLRCDCSAGLEVWRGVARNHALSESRRREQLSLAHLLRRDADRQTSEDEDLLCSRRTMRLTQLAVDCLHYHKVAQAEDRLKNHTSWNTDHLVFYTSSGAAYAASDWRREYCYPLNPKTGLPHIRPHGI